MKVGTECTPFQTFAVPMKMSRSTSFRSEVIARDTSNPGLKHYNAACSRKTVPSLFLRRTAAAGRNPPRTAVAPLVSAIQRVTMCSMKDKHKIWSEGRGDRSTAADVLEGLDFEQLDNVREEVTRSGVL